MYIVLVIAASYVCHYCYFKVGIVLTNYRAYVVIITEFAGSELVYVKHFLVALIAEFHVINA